MRQVERHWIKENHELYSICDELTFKAKNLYNAGLYQIRQSFFERERSKNGENYPILSWITVTSNFRKENQPDMLALPSKVASVTFSNGVNPLLVNGQKIKSINQGYNRLIAKAQSKLPKNQRMSKHIHRLWRNRGTKLQNELHKITSFLSQYFDEMYIEKVFIDKNTNWKSNVSMGKKTNQNFVLIPFNTFISQLRYKCLLKGIEVIEQEESYTSKASFVDDDEIPVYGKINYKPQFSGERIYRGLYKTKNGFKLNADVNGSYNILVKGLKSINKTIDVSNVSYHTRTFQNSNHKSTKDLVLEYM